MKKDYKKIIKPKKFFSWTSPSLEVRKTPEYGNGIFANKIINRGDRIAIIGGYIMMLDEAQKLPDKIKDEGLQIEENFVIGIKSESEIECTSYFNHSCNPNAGFRGQIFLVAIRKIKKDEEITFDYAMVLHKSKGVKTYKMKCLCGSKNCRGYITDNDWKKPELQKKYKGYFQWYLQEKINLIKK